MRYKELETLEFKKSTSELKEAVISIVAILNKHGKGKLYFGIKDDGTVVGQLVGRSTIKEVTQTIVDNIEPKIYPKVIEPEDFIKGKGYSILRNPLIAETMFRSEDIEKWASGIKRIYDECQKNHIRVEFHRVKTGFVIIFYRPKWEEGEGLEKGGQKRWSEKVVRKGGQKITAKQSSLLELIRQNSTISRKDISDKLGINESAVQKRIDSLKKRGMLRRVGPDKGGHWEISE